MEKLAAYLVHGTETDEEKARAIYRWITDRVAYDVQGFLADRFPDPSPETVLRTRSAVCEGYARLFQALAQEAGLEVEMVTGASKGFRGSRQVDHAWNAVKLNGRWRLFDSTWGSGAVNDQHQFVKYFNEHWYETPPEQFIFSHFPQEPRWQLLGTPLSREQFEKQARVTSFYFRYGLRARNLNAVLRGAGTLDVRLDTPPDVLLTAQLLKDGKPPSRPLTLVQRQGTQHQVRVMLPAAGQYQLRIFARQENQKEAYDWAMDYLVEATSARSPCPGYPRTFGAFTARQAVLLAPLDGRLARGSSPEFRLRVPGATAVRVDGEGGPQTDLRRSGTTFAGKVALPETGTVRVYAQFPGQAGFAGLLEYTVK